ncbi:MAG: hypothetical protein ACOC6C_05720 [Verrucomicrobiota bacterium]
MSDNTTGNYINDSLFPGKSKSKTQISNEEDRMFSARDLKKLAQKISSQQSEKAEQIRSKKKWNDPGRQ